MSRAVMFVYNDCRNDARVLREAATLVDAGYDVTIMARPTMTSSKEIEREQRDGFEIVRDPHSAAHVDSNLGLDALRRGGRRAGSSAG